VRFPVEWIREFVEIPASVDELASRLTAAGLVVDTVEGEGAAALLDIDVPTNRPDCMNVYGVAREVAAFSGRRLAPYPAGAPEAAGAPPAREGASVQIEASDLCRRYCARVVRGVRPGPSPDWIARRLRAVGLAPVNNVVDVTNYVLWELGQPIHAFDLALLRGRRIVVRRARKAESIQTLDGEMRHLATDALVIADAERPVAVAGVMGGANTMISAGTSDVLIESAWFDPASVRRTARRLGLSTDASYRFERGADVEAAPAAADRAADLLAQVAGGSVAPGLLDAVAGEAAAGRIVHLRLRRVEALLGLGVPRERAAAALAGLGFDARLSPDGFEVGVPSHRQDVACEADLVEEVARSVGYASVPDRLPLLPGSGAVHRFAHRREETLRESLLGSGYSEVITYSFVGSEEDWLLREEGAAAVALANPMAEGQDTLRSSLLPGLLQAVRHNLNHGVRDVRVFEVGKVFRRAEGAAGHEGRGRDASPAADEALAAGIAATGLCRPRHWLEPAREAGFYDVKGALDEALGRAGIRAAFEALPPPHPFRPGAAARIVVDGRAAGRAGILSAEAAGRLGIKAEAAVAEVDLTIAFAAPEERTTFRPLPRYPSAARDLALVVRPGVTWSEIEDAIREAGGALVARAAVFDRYTGPALPRGHVSLAVSVTYQHPERTLSAEEIQSAEARILAALGERFGITLRRQEGQGGDGGRRQA
jgi:phenylalanyl-tRNA synthetase beta chain